MAYKHGVYTSEVKPALTAPIVGTAGLQVIVGTAPVNMLKDPAAAVNVPLLVNNYIGGCGGCRLATTTLKPIPCASASVRRSA
ncbi:MAG: hypothetical protein ACLU9S_16240 [Oscillospiraceae bacterium]